MSDLPRSLEWVKRLVAIDTTSRNPNLPLLDVVADEARRLGLEPVYCPSEREGWSNLLVTVPDAQGGTAGGVMLSGHADCVPVDDQPWSSDPFVAEVRDDRVYGRGTSDMKSFLAVLLTALPDIAAAKLSEPIHLAVSFDEEIGCIGGAQIAADIARAGLTPRAAIIGEPTGMEVIRGHKSINLAKVTFRGKSSHSSITPSGVNAVEYAGRFIAFLRSIADDWRDNGPFDEAYPVTYSTLSTNIAKGGTAPNIVPDRCEVHFEFRGLVEVDPAELMAKIEAYARELEAEMKAEHDVAGVDFEILASVPGLEMGEDSGVVRLVEELGIVPSQGKVTFGTEAGQFVAGGIEAVVCGPGHIAQAHTADEYVDLDQLRAAEDFVARLVAHLSTENA